MSFNIVTVREENGEALMNVGAKYPPCSRCGHTNHIMGKYFAKKHADGTMLHNLGEIEEVEHEINNEVSTEMTTKHDDPCCHGDALIFIQPDVTSLMGRLNTSFKTVGISKNVDFTRQSIHN